MSTLQRVAVWLDDAGAPVRIVLNGRRYRVTDHPTPLDDLVIGITHPPAAPLGWRFQATDESGEARVFDVQFQPAEGQWTLIRSYL